MIEGIGDDYSWVIEGIGDDYSWVIEGIGDDYSWVIEGIGDDYSWVIEGIGGDGAVNCGRHQLVPRVIVVENKSFSAPSMRYNHLVNECRQMCHNG